MATETGQVGAYVFLSYASADRERAMQLADLLEANGIPVWVDRKSIAGGTSWSAEIVTGIEGSSVLVLLCSAATMASPNVQQEVQLAWEGRKPILPLLLERVQLPNALRYALAGRQWVDVLDHPDASWLPAALRALRGLGIESGPPTPAAKPAAAAAPPPLDPPPRHNLPLQLTSFVGREREVAEVTERLAGTRLLTLTGTGGCGKTRLALQVAANLQDTYADGVWLVELAPLADPGLILRTVATAVGVREVPQEPLATTLVRSLRLKELVLVVDNCEHLIAEAARVIDLLLRASPGLRVLATSREALGTGGEIAWRVPSLSLPPAIPPSGPGSLHPADPYDEIGRSEAVQLFLGRAGAAQPAFALTAQNAGAIAQICRRLDGIPLAIELAAARVRVLRPEQIAARLDDRFRLLTGGSRTALPRQQTLRATIDWSYDLLTEPERRLLRRLAVFVGGFPLEAAESVGVDGDAPSTLDVLSELIEKSLVQVDDTRAETRYALLETVRQYAEEKLLDVGEAEVVRTRHRDWCLGLAEQALPALEGSDQKRWSDRLEDEHDNLRAALTWSLAVPADALALLRLAAVLGRFWRLRGYNREAIGWLELAVARSAATPSVDRARALNWLGHFAWIEGDIDRAGPVLEESVAQARTVGDGKVLAEALRHLAYFAMSLGDQARARRLLEEAVAVGRTVGYKREIAYALHGLAGLLVPENALEVIEPLLVESGSIARESGDPLTICEAFFGLSWVYTRRGEFGRARSTLDECMTTARRADVTWPIMCAHLFLGDLATIEHDLSEAIDRYRQVLRVVIDVHRGLAGYALHRYAAVCTARGDHHHAARLFGAASAAPRAEDNFLLLARSDEAEEDLAAARQALGDEAFAAAWAEGQAMTLEQAIDYALESEQ